MEKITYIILLSLALMACSKTESKHAERAAIPVRTVIIAQQTNNAVARYVGVVEPAQETPLSMHTAGRVVSVEAKNGQRVFKGQTILSVDNTQALNTLQSAEATFRQAGDAYNRVSKVHDKGVVSDQKLVEIESQYTQAKALYAAAKEHLQECTLSAPCDGVLSGLNVSVGQSIIPGTKLCSILDISGFTVRFTVPEAEVGDLSEKGEMECAAVNRNFPVRLSSKSVTANPLTHTYEAVARVEGGKDILRTGMVGIVCLPVLRSEATVVPAKCILLKPEGATVWIKQDDQATRRLITIGGYEADGVRVLNGLEPGDVVITEGYQKLYEGCKVSENK